MGNVGETEKFAPENIAEAYWKMYEEKENFETNYEEGSEKFNFKQESNTNIKY